MNAIAYAEVDTAQLSRATSFASTAQQLAATLGIAFGSLVLEGAGALLGEGGTGPYAVAFVAVGALAASSSVWATTLPAQAGDELSGRGRPVQ